MFQIPLLRSAFKLTFFALLSCLLARTAGADDASNAQLMSARVQSAIGKLEDLTNETLKSTGVPGIAIAIVHQDEVVFKKGFGVRVAGEPQPVDADTVFQVASIRSRSPRPYWRR